MSETLLLVDDEEDIRRFLGLFLADLGYVVHAAANGEEALAMFDEVNPSIVLTDIKMPVMDGLELLKRIKARSPDTEVVMISGHGDMDLAINCLQYEAADFVTKPINHDILDAALKRIDEKLSLRRELRQYTQNLEKLVREKSSRVVELERQVAAGQMVETMCQAISGLSADFGDGAGYFNEMPCFVAVHNASLEVVATNQLYKERLGDMVGHHSWEVYVGQALRGFDGPVWKTFETGKGQRSRETMLCKNGRELPVMVHTSPIATTDGKVELVLEMAVDVSEIKRLQEELRVTQQKYMDLFDATPCYIAVRGPDCRIVANNHRFAEDFGESVGRTCYDAFKHRSEPCPDCPAEATFADGQPHYQESVVTTKGGQQRNVLISTAAIRNAAGEVVEVMEMSADITSIRQLQSHLTSLGLMLGSISHGVKGMLTALEGAVYRVESGLKRGDAPRAEAAAEAVKTLVGRVRALVLNVLYYAKSRELAPETVDVAAFASGIAQTVAPKAAREGVTLTAAIGQELGAMDVDAGNLSAALVNILENAVDACLGDTSKTERHIEFAVSREDGQVIFDITDNGMGMDQETREKAFTLFFSSKGLKGTGLGLFIANDMVAKHGGTIDLTSEPGVGTHFRVRLPERPLVAPAVEAAVPASGT
ncbi:multi-sensor signal transduction histidine kinase [Solidesulfovibrio carbinoliphilus subsp. oakridgensis]|uniref:histidine kinase n=1 Tax=Solidesulfovibrio carbinoliphilus subsp. oakridgensis TaxID=694327 RepID=G7QD85_9BACT|nr:response regulator [Solidesulfovibrio carbinoliphilus]EHJ46391.1 multi-sensor signal transduction histidine kinase [Solidesulfovibrio carbinoliphilus subsp. oakridgensis]